MRWRNVLYHTFVVLDPMRKEALAAIAKLTPEEREGIETAATIWEYDERFTACRAGKKTVLDYYNECSAIEHLAGIRIPTLCLAALDDPWVPGSGYVGYYWARNKFLTPLLTTSGGHVGFHGTASVQPWRDLAVAEFLHKAVRSR
jgi:predicted alpha/beta-fold hydrolase